MKRLILLTAVFCLLMTSTAVSAEMDENSPKVLYPNNYTLEPFSCDSVDSEALQGQNYRNPYTDIIAGMTNEEIDLLLRVLWAEANNQSMDGQRMVLECVFNRVLSKGKGFPDTVKGVLSQKGQFSTWYAAKNHKCNYTHVQTDALQIVLEEKPLLPSTDYVFFSRGKHRWMHDCIRQEDHWFGR